MITGTPDSGPGANTAVVTSQPPVATIPAGLPTGITTITYAASSTIESFVASIGPSTTIVQGGGAVSVTEGSSAGLSEPTGSGNNNGGGNSGGDSSSSTSSDNAAPTMKAAAGVIALGAFAVALI